MEQGMWKQYGIILQQTSPYVVYVWKNHIF